MKSDLFNLRFIKGPSLDYDMLQDSITRISELTRGMDGPRSPGKKLLDDFRKQMRAALLNGKNFDEATQVRRREWLLLSLYLNDLSSEESRSWLPPMSSEVVSSILGDNPEDLKLHLRRLVTQLYFTHFGFDRLPSLQKIASILAHSWKSARMDKLDPVSKVWVEYAETLFAVDGPDRVVEMWKPGMAVPELADTFHIHENGLFRKELIKSLILNRLRKIPLGNNDEELNHLVLTSKEDNVSSGLRLGAAAVQILINRSQLENHSKIPQNWKENLVMYACDPRTLNSAMQDKWWSWATKTEKEIAVRAIGEHNMLEFIRELEESLKRSEFQHQFPQRKRMLLRLFDLGIVQDVRLVVSRVLFEKMNKKTRGSLFLNWVQGGSQNGSSDTSFICMKCTDDVYLIEATGSFALRGFIGPNSFPIKKFWTSEPSSYADNQLRVKKNFCPIYQVHHTGNWINDLVAQLRRYNIEWRGLS